MDERFMYRVQEELHKLLREIEDGVTCTNQSLETVLLFTIRTQNPTL